MGDLLGGLMSSAASLINGSLNRSAQAAANDQNAQNNFLYATHSLDWKAGDAVQAEKDFGINRLVSMGVNPSGGPSTAVANNDDSVSKAGQDIGRAVAAYSDKNDKAAQLNNELLQAKIDQAHADTATTQLQNSRLARTMAAPGSGPGLAHRPGSEKPAYAPYDTWPYSLLSHDAASTQFGPTSFVTGAELLPGLLWSQAKGTYTHVAPHVKRAIQNLQLHDANGPIGNPAGDVGFGG